MGNLVAGPIHKLKEELEQIYPAHCREILQQSLVAQPDEEFAEADNFKELKEIFGHLLEIDMEKSGFESFSKRHELMTNLYLQAGFTTPEKKQEMLKSGDYKRIVIPTNASALKFSSEMQQKSLRLILCFLSRNANSSNQCEDFAAIAQKRMKKEMTGKTALRNSILSATLRPAEMEFNEAQIDDMLAGATQTEPLSLFCTSVQSFYDGLQHLRVQKILKRMIQNKRGVSELLRAKCIRLLLGAGLAHGSAHSVLQAVNSALAHKVNLIAEMEYFCQQSEQLKLNSDQEGNFQLKNEVEILERINYGDKPPRTRSEDRFVTDGKNWFFNREFGGLGKATMGSSGEYTGPYVYREENLTDCQLFLMNNRLYARHADAQDDSMVEIDKKTLKDVQGQAHFTGKNGQENPLEWTPVSTEYEENTTEGNRWVRSCPLFFDGDNLHALICYTSQKHTDNVVKIALETYSIEGHTISLEQSVSLIIEDEGESAKYWPGDELTLDEIQQVIIACNDQHLLLLISNKAYVFDQVSGKQLALCEVGSESVYCYDPIKHKIFFQDVASYSFLKSCSLKGFAKKQPQGQYKKLPKLPTVFDSLKKQMLEEIKVTEKEAVVVRPCLDPFDEFLFGKQSTSDNVSEPESNQVSQIPDLHVRTKALVLSVMGLQAHKTIITLMKMPGSLTDDQLFEFIKTPLAVEINTDYITMLRAEVESYILRIVQTAKNSTEQLNRMLMSIKLLQANLLCLSKSKIDPKDLLSQADYAGLISSTIPCLEKLQTKLNAEIGRPCKTDPSPEQIFMMHLQQNSFELINIISEVIPESFNQNVRKLYTAINALNQDKETDTELILKILRMTTSETLSKCFESEELVLKLKRVLKLILVRQSQTFNTRLVQALAKNEIKALDLVDTEMMRFALCLCQGLLISLGQVMYTIEENGHLNGAQKSKLSSEDARKLLQLEKARRRKQELEPIFYDTFIMVSIYFRHQLFKVTAMVWEAQLHHWKEGKEAQEKFYQRLTGMISEEASLTKIVTHLALGVSCFIPSVTWLDEIAEALRNCMQGCTTFIDMSNNYPSAHCNKLNEINSTKKYLMQTMRNLQYSLGNVACQLIQRDYGDLDEVSNQMSKLSILQGGIEKRFIPALSSEAKRQIEGSFKIVQDKELRELSLQDVNQIIVSKQHSVLQKLIGPPQQGCSVNDVIAVLQVALLKKRSMMLHARLGGEDGLRLSRAAFSVIIKFSQHVDAFIALQKEVNELARRVQPGKDKNEQIKAMLEEAKSENFISCMTHWEQASQMRKWTNQIRQKISERVTKEVTEEMKAELPNFAGVFDDRQKQEIDNRVGEREVTEKQKHYEQVYEKANILIMLQVPKAFLEAQAALKKPQSKQNGSQRKLTKLETVDNLNSMTMLRRHTDARRQMLVNDATHSQKDTEIDWRDKLRKWKKVQLASGGVNSMAQAVNEGISASVHVSVLGCLQADYNAKQLQSKVEEQLVKGLRRSAGLEILEFAMQNTTTNDVFFDALQWFMGSLLKNKSCATHYLEGLEGCGSDVEHSIQTKFFNIIRRVIFELKNGDNSKDKTVHLINAIGCWDYKPSDHQHLVELGVVQILTNPDPECILNDINLAWGIESEFYTLSTDKKEDFALSGRLSQVFQFFTRTVLSGLTSQQSNNTVIDWSATEKLIKQILATFKSNFERFLGNWYFPHGAQCERRFEFNVYTNESTPEDKLLLDDNGAEMVLLPDTYEYVKKLGGGQMAILNKKLSLYLEQRKVQDFIEKVTTTEIMPGSRLFKALENFQEGKDAAQAIGDVVQHKMYALDNLKNKSWEELDLVKPVLTSEEIEELTGFSKTEWDTKNELKSDSEVKQLDPDADAQKLLETCIATNVSEETDILPFQKRKDYSDISLFKLMELLDTYLSMAGSTFVIAERVCQPDFLAIVIRLSVEASSNLQFMAHKLLQQILLLDPPVEVLNQAVLDAQNAEYGKGRHNMVEQLLVKTSPLVFEGCPFLQLYFNQLYMSRLALYNGQLYEERSHTSTVDEAVRTIRISIIIRDKNDQMQQVYNNTLQQALLERIEELSEPEIDSIMTLIAEAQFERIAVGTPCLDKEGRRFTVIGMQQTEENHGQKFDNLIVNHNLSIGGEDLFATIVGLSYDALAPEQQEIITDIRPNEVQTLIDLDAGHEIEGARNSLFMNPAVVKKLLTYLATPDDKQKRVTKVGAENLLKTFIARGFNIMSQTLGLEYVNWLWQLQESTSLIKMLLNQVQVEFIGLPLTMMELKADAFREKMIYSLGASGLLYQHSFQLEFKSDSMDFSVTGVLQEESMGAAVLNFTMKKCLGTIPDHKTCLNITHVNNLIDMVKSEDSVIIEAEQLRQVSIKMARYINKARVVICDDTVDLAQLFNDLANLKLNRLVELDHLDQTCFVIVDQTSFKQIKQMITQPPDIAFVEEENDSDKEAEEQQRLLVASIAEAQVDADINIEDILVTLDEFQLFNLHAPIQEVDSEQKLANEFSIWAELYDEKIGWKELQWALRRANARKFLIAMFSSAESMSSPEAIEVFAQGETIRAQIANMIHLEYMYSSINAVFYGQTQQMKPVQTKVHQAIAVLKSVEGFKQVFSHDMFKRAIGWLMTSCQPEHKRNQSFKLTDFKDLSEGGTGLYHCNLVDLQKIVTDLGCYEEGGKTAWLVNLFNINLCYAMFTFENEPVEQKMRQQLLESACDALQLISEDDKCLQQAIAEPKLLDRLLNNKLLNNLFDSIGDLLSELLNSNDSDFKSPLILPHIVRIALQLVTISNKLKTQHQKDTDFVTNLKPSLKKIMEAYNVVVEGSSFESMVKTMRSDLVISFSGPEAVRHFRQTYKSDGRISANKRFKKKITVKDDTIVQILGGSLPNMLSFSNKHAKSEHRSSGSKLSFKLEAGISTIVEYPVLGGTLNISGKIGKMLSYDKVTQLSKDNGAIPVERVYSTQNDLLVQGSDGKIYGLGEKIGSEISGESDQSAKLRNIPIPHALQGKVKKVTTGKFAQVILSTEGRVFVHGHNRRYAFGSDVSRREYLDAFHELSIFPLSPDETIVDVAFGTNHIGVVSSKGLVYASGYFFYRQFDSSIRHSEQRDEDYPFRIEMPEGHQARQLWLKSDTDIYILCEKTDGSFITLRQDDGQIKPVQDLAEDLYFKQLTLAEVMRCGIDNNGVAWWLWDDRVFDREMLDPFLVGGDLHSQRVAKIQWFIDQKLTVEKIELGFYHAIFLVHDESGNKKLFGAMTIKAVEDEYTPMKLFGLPSKVEHHKTFHELEIDINTLEDFTCGKYATYYVFAELLHDQVPSIVPNKPEASGLIHFFKQGSEWQFMLAEEYESRKANLPDLCFACSEPITDFTQKQFPQLQASPTQADAYSEKCSDTNEQLSADKPIYVAHFKDETISQDSKWIFASEDQMMSEELKAWDISSLIWFRVKRPLKNLRQQLPCLSIADFFDLSEKENDGITVRCSKEQISQDDIDKVDQSSLEAQVKMVTTDFSQAANEELLNVISQQLTMKKTKIEHIDKVDPESITIDKKALPADSLLRTMDDEILQLRIKLSLAFSQKWLDLAQMVEVADFNKENSLSNIFKKQSWLALPLAVEGIVNQYLTKLMPEDRDMAEVEVSRRKALMFIDSGKTDDTGSFTVFGQIVTQLESKGYAHLRSFRKFGIDQKPFGLKFLGEGGIDAGGLFRDALVNIAQELMSPALRLLTRTPNNKNDFGNFRECYMLNSEARSPTNLKLLRYLGALLAFNIASGSPMPLNMAPFFWKNLAGEDYMSVGDLDGIDSYSSQMLANMRQYSGFLGDEEFEASIEQTFTTVLSNGDEVELCENGQHKRVTKANLNEFIELVLKARSSETIEQMRAIRSGLQAVMQGGVSALALLPWSSLEARACGAKIFDMEKFKSITTFPRNEPSHRIVGRFWRVFEAFNEEEKALYLKFVWGRSRLPIDCSMTDQHEVRLMDMDKRAFPLSHTCFFQLDIPDYETDEICREKLTQASLLCGQIDNDGNAADEDD